MGTSNTAPPPSRPNPTAAVRTQGPAGSFPRPHEARSGPQDANAPLSRTGLAWGRAPRSGMLPRGAAPGRAEGGWEGAPT